MTPKEKAEELANKFYNTIYLDMDYIQAKYTASIVVDEIIDELTSRGILSGFWYEVHEEIKKL